jgi:hypothetical protein
MIWTRILLGLGEQSGEPGMMVERGKHAGFMSSYVFEFSAHSDA